MWQKYIHTHICTVIAELFLLIQDCSLYLLLSFCHVAAYTILLIWNTKWVLDLDVSHTPLSARGTLNPLSLPQWAGRGCKGLACGATTILIAFVLLFWLWEQKQILGWRWDCGAKTKKSPKLNWRLSLKIPRGDKRKVRMMSLLQGCNAGL